MVSRRNFFTIMTLLMIMLFMFMFVSVIREELNIYDVNPVAMEDADKQELKQRYDNFKENLLQPESGQNRVIYLGDGEVKPVLENWCTYTKRSLKECTTLQGMHFSTANLPEVIVVDGESVSMDGEAERLTELVQKGCCVIFATMPAPKTVDESDALKKLMGINMVYSEGIWLDGMHLFPGLLIGGEKIYEAEDHGKNRYDKEFYVPWYMTGAGTKTYMMGIIEDTIWEDPFLPAILWRNSLGEGRVFCVNGNYLKEMYGVGLLTAFMAEEDTYDLYPVVNAQNLVLANFGGFCDENSELMYEVYNQPQSGVFREVVWPAMVALNEKTSGKISMMITTQMDYSDEYRERKGQLVYYLKMLNEYSGEAGLSTFRNSDISLEDKIARDEVYWRSETEKYRILSMYVQDREEAAAAVRKLPELRTITFVQNNAVPVSYLQDSDVTLQAATSIGVEYTFLKDFAVRNLETALGYSNIVLDMSIVTYPKQNQYWEVISGGITRNLSTYWKDFEGFHQTTLTDSDERIRRFFALEGQDSRQGDVITLHVDGFQEKAFFVLKLNKEDIAETDGCVVTSLKNDFYLLEIQQPDVKIRVESRKGSTIY